jgi:hypothetical protein
MPGVSEASKAVVYQWESGRREPSPVFWLRIQRLQRQLANSSVGLGGHPKPAIDGHLKTGHHTT